MAYGDYHQQQQQEGQEGERGFIGDMGRRVFGGHKEVSTFDFAVLRRRVLGASPGMVLVFVGGCHHDTSSYQQLPACLDCR